MGLSNAVSVQQSAKDTCEADMKAEERFCLKNFSGEVVELFTSHVESQFPLARVGTERTRAFRLVKSLKPVQMTLGCLSRQETSRGGSSKKSVDCQTLSRSTNSAKEDLRSRYEGGRALCLKHFGEVF